MSINSSSSPGSQAIDVAAFLQALFKPLVSWGLMVGFATWGGQPGVVCFTPMAWLLALWCGILYVQASGGRPGLLGPALTGAMLGVSMGLLFVILTSQLPLKPEEVINMEVLTACMVVGGIVICMALSAWAAHATLRRYNRRFH